jgi:hypothetical protein
MFDEAMKLLSPLGEVLPTGDRIAEIFETIIEGTDNINSRFTQSRQRVTEFSAAIADSIPMVERLGGTSKDAAKVIDDVAAATKRNVVASADEVSKLYSIQQLTGTDAKTLVGTFQNIGVQFSQISNQVGDSIKYIQSIGGNARDIMREVTGYVEKINSYNFQDGVLGLTRMATQAQLLKFDMSSTLGFAEKVMSPEGAIQMASAFQRLGVAAGDLTDPFQLMNKSLNDPEGLQNSIVNMTKQFTFFDEKTNSFKINPQGMLMLREIGTQAGISSAELSRMALNAADLDKKISQISPSFEFENEQDKQYIANIAKMGTGGEYEITVKQDGKDKTIPLQEANNEQLKELIERQKEGQEDKTTEDIQKDQLDVLTLMVGELKAARDTYLGGIASSRTLTEALNGVSSRLGVMNTIQQFKEKQGIDKVTTGGVRNETDNKIDEITGVVKTFFLGNKDEIKAALLPLISDVKKFSTDALAEVTKGIGTVIDYLKTTYSGSTGRASGGYVYGEGTSTSDSIPTLLSNGEFVVNAKSTESFGPLLEVINKNPDYDLNNFTNERLNNIDLTKFMSLLNTQNTTTETENENVEPNIPTNERLNEIDLTKFMASLNTQSTPSEPKNNKVESTESINERLNNVDLTKFMTSLNPPNIPSEPKSQNTTPNNFVTDKLELKNTNDIAASNITNRSITEQISNLNTSTANTEMKTSKIEFGEIAPLKVIFEKGPGFSDSDMAMLEYNLGKSTLTEQLTKSLSEKLKILQVKDA